MVVVLSLLAAASYGLSDFLGGVTSRRVSPWSVALLSQVGGGLAVLVIGLVAGGSPRAGDLGWAVLAGVGNGVGTAFLYRGLGAGRMGVVAPVSGVGAAVLPVAVGLLAGERPAILAWVGILVALPAIWLVAREPSPTADDVSADDQGAGVRSGPTTAALVDGLLAGAGFGTLFAALAQVPESSGFLPLALNQAVGTVIVAVVATGLGAAWVPRSAWAGLGLVCGCLGASATVLFLLATHAGLLTVSAVITSLYPAGTVLLAAVLLRERIHAGQGAGLALCAVCVALIAV